MSVLTFISELAKALAWPCTVVLITILLRGSIVELIPLLRKLKYKELELEFSKEVAELKVESVARIADDKSDAILGNSSFNNMLSLASISARAAIMEAWLEVESASATVASSLWQGGNIEIFRNYNKLGEYLLQCKVIDEKQLLTYNKLRHLRNKAAHTTELELSETDAKSYVILAAELVRNINRK